MFSAQQLNSDLLTTGELPKDKGSIVILTVFLSFAFLVMIGLMIDSSMWAANKTGHHHSAQFGALAALEAYVDSTLASSGTFLQNLEVQMTDALNTGKAVAAFNFSRQSATAFTDTPSALDSISFVWNSTEPFGTHGAAMPGVWHFEEPDPANDGSGCVGGYTTPAWALNSACPCPSGAWNGPCFQEIRSGIASGTEEPPVNAVRVVYKSDTNIGSSVMGAYNAVTGSGTPPKIGFTSMATAAVVPRHAVFLLDLSASMTEDNFRAITDLRGAEELLGRWAFHYEETESCDPTGSFPEVRTFLGFPLPYSGVFEPLVTGLVDRQPAAFHCLNNGGFRNLGWPLVPGWDNCNPMHPVPAHPNILPYTPFEWNFRIWSGVAPADPWTGAPGGFANPSLHNQEDYSCIDMRNMVPTVYQSQLEAARGATNSSLVEVTTEDPSPFFLINTDGPLSPQPLTAALSGIHSAMLEMESVSVGADKIGVIAFDNQLLKVRATHDGTDYPRLVPVDLTNDEYREFRQATDTTGMYAPHNNPLLNKTLRYLFPREISNREDPIDDLAHTDLRLGFALAAEAIESEDLRESADNFVILFTDGLPNCVSTATGVNPTPTDVGLTLLPGPKYCVPRNFEYHDLAFQQAVDIMQKDFVDEGWDIHVFLTGDTVAPHTLVKKGDPSADPTSEDACLTDRMARTNSEDFVNSTPAVDNATDFNGRSQSAPYFRPNELYQQAKASGGSWSPLRPKCPGGDPTTPGDQTPFEVALYAACAAAPGSAGAPVTPSGILTAPVIDDDTGNTIYPSAIDSAGRLLCDPKRRSKDQQVQERITEIFELSPFMLVAENPS